MKFARAFVTLCGIAPALAATLGSVAANARGGGHGAHTVGSVIELLEGLRTKVVEEGQAEEVTYAKFAKWCQDSERTLQKAVTASKESIDSLTDEVNAKTQENLTLTEQIEKLTEEVAKYEGTDSEAEQRRNNESAAYSTADTDFGTTIQAFTDAIQALETAQTSSSGAALLQGSVMQTLTRRLPAEVLGFLSEDQLAMLQKASRNDTERPDLLAKGDYGNHTQKYKFKSGNVIELLKQLKADFGDQRVEATKAETNAANAYSLAKDARAAALLAARTALGEKETEIGQVQTDLNTAQGSLSSAKGDLSGDEATLGTTTRSCDMKQSEWEERVAIREKEKKAIEAGIKILAKVSGVRTDAPTNPVMPPPPADAPESTPDVLFLQESPANRALNLLRREASRLHSKSFMRFAEQVAAKTRGPFDGVNDMIQKMIFRLIAEQTDEDDHKNWCDMELTKTNTSKKNKEDKLTELDLKMVVARTSVNDLSQEIQDAHAMVAKIDGFVEEATEIRNAGKKENSAAIKDAEQAQQAIARAIALLAQFYKETGMVAKEAWEFMQKGAAPVTLPENPATWESDYTGVADPKNQPDGIISVLKTIASDFSTMEAATRAQESTDELNFQQEIKAQTINKAKRAKEAELKNQEKQRLSEKIIAMEHSMKHTREEKGAMEQYLKDLEPACIQGDSTYEERKQAREDEISALKEAQVILADAFTGNATGNATLLLQGPRLLRERNFLAPIHAVK